MISKGRMRKVIAVLMAAIMCVGMVPAMAFADDGDSSDKDINLLVFGNSTSSGYGMPDFYNFNKGFAPNNNYLEEWAAEEDGYTQDWTDEKAFTLKAAQDYVDSLGLSDNEKKTRNMYNGLGRISNSSYPWQLKKYMTEEEGKHVELTSLALNGMRSDELRAFLDKDFYDKGHARERRNAQRYLDDHSDEYEKTGRKDEKGDDIYYRIIKQDGDIKEYEKDEDTGKEKEYTIGNNFPGFITEHIGQYVVNLKNGGVTGGASYEEAQEYVKKSISDADVIVLDLVGNNFGSYIGYRVSALLGMKISCAPNLYETIADLEDVPEDVRNTIDSLVKQLGSQYPAIASGAARQLLDAYIFATADAIVNFSADVEMVRELNPEAKIIAVGMNNQMYGLLVEAGGSELPFGKVAGMMMDIVNTYIRVMDKNSGNYYYADVPEHITSFVDSIRNAETIEEVQKDGAYEDGLGAYSLELMFKHFNLEYMNNMFAGTAEDFYNNVLGAMLKANFSKLGMEATLKDWDELSDDEIISVMLKNEGLDVTRYLAYNTEAAGIADAIVPVEDDTSHPAGKPDGLDPAVYITKKNIAETTERIRQLLFDAAHKKSVNIEKMVALTGNMDEATGQLIQYVFGFRDDVDDALLGLLYMFERFILNSGVGEHPDLDGCYEKYQAVLAAYLSDTTARDEVIEQIRDEVKEIYAKIIEISGRIRESDAYQKIIEELQPIPDQLKAIAVAAYMLPEYEAAVDAYAEVMNEMAGSIADLQDKADELGEVSTDLVGQVDALSDQAADLKTQLTDLQEKNKALEEQSGIYDEEIKAMQELLKELEARKAALEFSQKKVSLKKAAAGKKSFTAKWKKLSGANGYQVSYKVVRKKTYKKTVKGGSKVSLKVKKLKSGKKYTVKVRAYKTINGKKYWSKWSSSKKVSVR